MRDNVYENEVFVRNFRIVKNNSRFLRVKTRHTVMGDLIWVNFGYLGFFDVYVNLSARVFLPKSKYTIVPTVHSWSKCRSLAEGRGAVSLRMCIILLMSPGRKPIVVT